MWRPSVFGLSVVYNVYIVAKRCILSVPAFALRELCGCIGPPILGGRHFRGKYRFYRIYSTLLQSVTTENKNLQRSDAVT